MIKNFMAANVLLNSCVTLIVELKNLRQSRKLLWRNLMRYFHIFLQRNKEVRLIIKCFLQLFHF
jgi:hypothetical protein